MTEHDISAALGMIAEHPDCDFTEWERAFLRAVADDHAAGRPPGSTGVGMGFFPSTVASILGNIAAVRPEIAAERAAGRPPVSPRVDPQASTLATFVADKLAALAGKRTPATPGG